MKNGTAIELVKDIRDTRLADSFNLNVNRYYTDPAGTILAAVPAAFAGKKMPVFLLGEFDRQGGYKQALAMCPPEDGVYFLTSFIEGSSYSTFNIVGFSGLNDLRNAGRILPGDVVTVFTDNLQAPGAFCWIVQTSGNVSYGSILSNLKTTQADNKFNRLWVDFIHYGTANNNVRQWNEAMIDTRVNNVGLVKFNDFIPNIERVPNNFQNDIIILDVKFFVDQFIGLNTYMLSTTTQMQFIFKLKK